MPIGVAPMAYHRLAHDDGEVATAAAAGAVGALFVVPMLASRAFADIAAAASGPLWLQLYWLRRREALADVLRRAEQAGFRALALTVDAPRLGRRYRDARNGFALPPGVSAVNVDPAVMASASKYQAGTSALERHASERFDPTISWADLEWLRRHSPLPLVLKGVLTGEDAALAVEHGVDALVVSNHGGRQLDGAVPSIDALSEVAEAVAGRIPVLLDGGVRTGGDVFAALALGATAVLVGRPVLWGLACAGADGARAVLEQLGDELDEVMALSGRPRLADIDSRALRLPPVAALDGVRR
jgi:4-hydroxymandelate oxidase